MDAMGDDPLDNDSVLIGDELDALMAEAEEEFRDLLAAEGQLTSCSVEEPSQPRGDDCTVAVEEALEPCDAATGLSHTETDGIHSPQEEEMCLVGSCVGDIGLGDRSPVTVACDGAMEALETKTTEEAPCNPCADNTGDAEEASSELLPEPEVVVRRRGKPKKSKVRQNKERALREAKARAEAEAEAEAEERERLESEDTGIFSSGAVQPGSPSPGDVSEGEVKGEDVKSDKEEEGRCGAPESAPTPAEVLISAGESDPCGYDENSLGGSVEEVVVRRQGKLKKPKVRQNKERALKEAKARTNDGRAGGSGGGGFRTAAEKEKRAREELLQEQRAQIASLSDPEKRRHQKRAQIVHEIITTEKSYLNSLEYITKNLLAPAAELGRKYREEKDAYPAAESAVLSTSTAVILGFSRMLLDMLVSRFSTWQPLYTCIGDVFLSVAEYLKSYTNYVNCYEPFVTKLAKVLKKDKELQDELCLGKSFLFCESKLIIPVQRIPRYLLLLRELLDHTTSAHPDYNNIVSAVEKIEGIAHYINEQHAKYESMNRVLLVEKTFGKKLTDNTGIKKFIRSHRFVVHEGELSMHYGGKVKKVLVYLLNDVVVIGKVGKPVLQWGGSNLQACFPLWTVCLLNHPCEPKMEHMFELVANETGDSRALLQAANAGEKGMWIDHIRVVLNHLNNAIALGANSETGKVHDEEHLQETFALLENERRATLEASAAVALKPRPSVKTELAEQGATPERCVTPDRGSELEKRSTGGEEPMSPKRAFLGSRAMRRTGDTPPRHLPLRSPSAPAKTQISATTTRQSGGGGWTSVRVKTVVQGSEGEVTADVATPTGATAATLAPEVQKQLSLLAESEEQYLRRLRSLGKFLRSLVNIQSEALAEDTFPEELFGVHTAVQVLATYTKMHGDQCRKLLATPEVAVPGQLGDIFLQLTEYFHVYVQYLRDFEPFVKALASCIEQKELRSCLPGSVNFEELLVCPILRIDFYEEQLRQFVTFASKGAADAPSDSDQAKLTDALGRIQELCSFVSERREFYNSAARLLDVIWLFGDSLTEGAGLHCSFLRSHRLLRHGGILVLSGLAPARGRSRSGALFVCDVDGVELAIGELCSVLLFNDVLLVGQLPRTAGPPAWGATSLYSLVRLAKVTASASKGFVVFSATDVVTEDGCCIELVDKESGEVVMQLQAGDDDVAAQWLDRIENVLMSLELACQRGANAPSEQGDNEGHEVEAEAQDELPRAAAAFLKMQTMMTNRSHRLTLLMEHQARASQSSAGETVFKGMSRRTMTPIHAPQGGGWQRGRLSELPVCVPQLMRTAEDSVSGKTPEESKARAEEKVAEADEDVDMEITILCTRYQDQLKATLQFPVIAERHRRVLASGMLQMVTPMRSKKVWMYLLNDCILISSVEGKVPGSLLLSSMRLLDVRTIPCKVSGKPGFKILLDLTGKVQGEFIVGSKEKLNEWTETVVEAKRLLRQAMSAGISEEVDSLMAERTDLTPGSEEALGVRRQLFDDVGKKLAAAEDLPTTAKDLLWEQAKARDQIVRARQRASSSSKFPKWLQLSGK